jgi:hypothetical protein
MGSLTLALPPGNYAPGGSDPNTVGNTAPYGLPLDEGTPPIPMVVTSTLTTGAPASAFPLWNTSGIYGGGVLAADPIYNSGSFLSTSTSQASGNPPVYTNALKAAWLQFLWLRHGGSGYMFGFGNGAVGQNVSILGGKNAPGPNGAPGGSGIPAEIPFHSLSYPDIDHTVMRPAALPPTIFTSPAPNVGAGTLACTLYGTAAPGGSTPPYNNPLYYGGTPLTTWNMFSGDPGVRNYLLYSGYPSANLAANPSSLPSGWTMNAATTYFGYPGAATPAPASPSDPTPPSAVAPPANTYWPVYPPPIPVRRLFQIPDSYNGAGSAPSATSASPSNAGETGDPSLNLQTPTSLLNVPTPAPGALPPIILVSGATTYYGVLTNSVANLYWPGSTAASLYTVAGGATPAATVKTPSGTSHYYGAAASGSRIDNTQHPYWRTEHLQRIINQTTVRTHQYAVWITIGFFEVTKQGDLGMLASSTPQLAFDVLGSEVGSVTGNNVRYRGFFLIDRTKLLAFNPGNTGSFRQAVVYRKVIQ